MDTQAPAKKKSALPTVVLCVAFFPFFLGALQSGLRLSHTYAAWKFENQGVSIQAVVMELEHVVIERQFGGEQHHSEHWWVRYLPLGQPNDAEHLIWEGVTPSEFERFHEGQAIEAWILPSSHRIKGCGVFQATLPEWMFFGVGSLLLALGLGLKRGQRS